MSLNQAELQRITANALAGIGPPAPAEQSITSNQPVVIQPTTDAAVTTTTAGPATLDATPVPLGVIAERALLQMPWAVLVAIGVIGVYIMALMTLCLWLWLQDNNPRAGQIVLGVGALVTPLVTYIFGLFTHPPVLGPRPTRGVSNSAPTQ